jgi:hypothetical protein
LPIASRPEEELAATREVLNALPEERRWPAIRHGLKNMFDREAVRTALALLPDVPKVELADAILERCADVAGWPKRKIIAELSRVAANLPAIEAHIAPYIAALPPLEILKRGESLTPSSESELTPLQRAQCADGSASIQGCGTDWVDDEEIEYLEFAPIFDAQGNHRFDLVLFMDEDGVIYRAGTTDRVATVCQYALYCDDPTLKESLQLALAD